MQQQDWATWREATTSALYGEGGFYRRTHEGPRAHFRTSPHVSGLFALALLTLAREAGLFTVVDLGSGGGELLMAMHAIDPDMHLVGVDVADRPAGLPVDIEWRDQPPQDVDALLVANELLDNIPVDVVELTKDGPRLVEVTPTGDERLAGEPDAEDLAWLARWWPMRAVGDRAEVGRPRDEVWARAVRSLASGVAVAIDYAHTAADRPPRGSLTGYRVGRLVAPVPDGSCDITSDVALDACAAAGLTAGARESLVTSQRAALHALGVRPEPADPATAAADPLGYLAALQGRGEAAELTARGGLGDFAWLVQTVGMPSPSSLVTLAPNAADTA